MRSHFNISLDFLERFIKERGNDGLILDGRGRSATKRAALKFLADQRARGIKFISPHCPTPLADGSCPTHTAETEAPKWAQ